MEIKHVFDCPEAIPVITNWLVDEWGHTSDELNFENISSFLQKQTIMNQIPETFVAIKKGKFIGTASLYQNDLSTRPDLTPWLAAVYVDPEFRTEGVGSGLVKYILKESHQLGIKNLYLWTANKMDFYSKIGWKFFENTIYLKKLVTIMIYDL